MKLQDFFAAPGKKVLITNGVKNGNRLRRCYNRNGEKNATAFITTKTPVEIAYELVTANAALENIEKYTYISNESGAILLDGLLKKDPLLISYDFIPERSRGLHTSEELYHNLCLLRTGKVSVSESDDKKGLFSLARVFEEILEEDHLLDTPLCFSMAIQILKDEKVPVEFLLPYMNEAFVASLETDRFSYAEEEFISLLAQKAGAKRESNLSFLSEESQIQNKTFYKGYGLFNEISHIVDEILDKKLPYGSVSVYYMSEDYVNILRMVFENRGIPITFSSGLKCTTTNIVQFMLRTLDFFEDDFNYGTLEKLILNPILEVEDEKDSVKLNYITGYRRAGTEGIGWGKQRYKDYCKRVLSDKEKRLNSLKDSEKEYEINRIAFAEFLEELVEVSDETSVSKFYEALLNFTWSKLSKINTEKKMVANSLFSQKEILAFYKDEVPLKERCEAVRNILENMEYTEEESTDAVNAIKFSGFEVLERKNLFFIGLSTKYVHMSDAQSPVLSDEELMQYLDCTAGYVPLATNRNEERKEYMEDTLKTGHANNVYFGFSNFDTTELKECSPSLFYLEQGGDDNVKIIEYKTVQDKSADIIWNEKEYHSYADEYMKDEKDQATKEIGTDAPCMSASGLQTLLSCPFQYYYQKIRGIRVTETPERKGHQWLSAAERGNLSHATFEKYLEKMFPQKETDTPKPFDENVFLKCYEDTVREVLERLPYPSKVIFDKEKAEVEEINRNYLKRLHENWTTDWNNGKQWVNIGREEKFEDVSYHQDNQSVDKDGKKNGYELLFNGSIDRLDAYAQGDTLHFRIVDYKTGKPEKKEEEVKKNLQIQHYVYAFAVYDIFRAHPERIKQHFPGKKIKKICIDDVYYEFPFSPEYMETGIYDVSDRVIYSKEDETKLPYEVADENGLSFEVISDFPSSVKGILKDTEGLRQSGRFDEIFEKVEFRMEEDCSGNYDGDYGKYKDDHCKYCDYKPICRMNVKNRG